VAFSLLALISFHPKHRIPLRLHGLYTRAIQSYMNIAPPVIIDKSPSHEDVMLIGLNSYYFGRLSGTLIQWNAKVIIKSLFSNLDWRVL
jgi:hypothetical protein